uniref:Photosystem II reaction center protein Psb30 n=1 Tax=Schizocladia ischiensis TaxID=196139 RepID=A0A7S6U9W1_9STRA|nr:Ycf12 [Schizocladia ischiensis]QOW07508.1 Ycf12 [Schizocladia ischiensis]
MNWQVIGQLVSAAVILLAGPAVIVLVAFKKGNL